MANKAAKSKEWVGAFEVFNLAAKQIMKSPAPMWFFVGTYTLINVISLVMQGQTNYADPDFKSYADAIILVFIVPLTVYGLARADDKELTLGDFMQLRLFTLLMLIGMSVLAALAILGSLLLLIIPAVWTIAWFCLSSYVLVDKGLGPIDALKESKRLAQNHKGKVWAFIGASLVLSILAAIIATIPFVGVAAVAFASVLSTVAAANLYRWLQTQA